MRTASAGGAPAADGADEADQPQPVLRGNVFDKYGSENPLVKRLMKGFETALEQLLDAAAASSILDVGCGEGVLTERWARRIANRRVVGVDLPDPKLEREWAGRRAPNLSFRGFSGVELPFEQDEFTLVAAIEVLEHAADPRQLLAEMKRVAASHLLVSVPREPLWRMLNLVRGAYVPRLGNTPGHRNHWTRASFMRLLNDYGVLLEVRSPVPWTVLLVDVS